MNKVTLAVMMSLALAACDNQNQTDEEPTESAQVLEPQVEQPDPEQLSQELIENSSSNFHLSDTLWQGTLVRDANNDDLTEYNQNYIGLAHYGELGDYEFFDKETGESRGDYGYYFVTNDGEKRILVSEGKQYAAIVDMVKLSPEVFTYQRAGKNANGEPVNVFVEHQPYLGKFQLKFNHHPEFKHQTGQIITTEDGADILAGNLWQGTQVLSDDGTDLTAYNQNFIGLARYDSSTNQYEFFDKETGKSKGDYGYFDVLHNNKLRVIVSQGKKYHSVVELTELNPSKFTYRRMGKDENGEPTWVSVEHVPYQGEHKLELTQ